MTRKQIAVLPGDGIGKDVMEAAMKILDAVGFRADYEYGDIGWEFWRTEGTPLPDRTVELLKKTDCALCGAITSKPKEEAESDLLPEFQNQGRKYSSPIVKVRQEFNLHTNLRPCKAFPGNPLNYRDDIDIIVFRENTEGLYAGVEYHPLPREVVDVMTKYNRNMGRFAEENLDDVAVSCRVFTRKACRNIARSGFEYAKEFGYKSVTVVEKPNVIRETSGMMVREARKVAKEYPGIELWETNIDAQCMWLLKNPQEYGVIVSTNMFGDILSDLCAQLIGGLGFSPSSNIGDNYAVFEPTHGSAPKYAEMNKVNPIAMILTAKLMLEWLGETEFAQRIVNAVAEIIKEEKIRTYDMGGSAGTIEMTDAIINRL